MELKFNLGDLVVSKVNIINLLLAEQLDMKQLKGSPISKILITKTQIEYQDENYDWRTADKFLLLSEVKQFALDWLTSRLQHVAKL